MRSINIFNVDKKLLIILGHLWGKLTAKELVDLYNGDSSDEHDCIFMICWVVTVTALISTEYLFCAEIKQSPLFSWKFHER